MSTTEVKTGKPPQRAGIAKMAGLATSRKPSKARKRTPAEIDLRVSDFVRSYAGQLAGAVRSGTRPSA